MKSVMQRTNYKQKVFIFARKRNISVSYVYDLLKMIGVPPTYRISPRTEKSPYIGPDGNTYYQRIRYDMRKKREITKEQYEMLLKKLQDAHMMQLCFGNPY